MYSGKVRLVWLSGMFTTRLFQLRSSIVFDWLMKASATPEPLVPYTCPSPTARSSLIVPALVLRDCWRWKRVFLPARALVEVALAFDEAGDGERVRDGERARTPGTAAAIRPGCSRQNRLPHPTSRRPRSVGRAWFNGSGGEGGEGGEGGGGEGGGGEGGGGEGDGGEGGKKDRKYKLV